MSLTKEAAAKVVGNKAHMYPGAGVAAPPGVQVEIAKFRALPVETRKKIPLLYYLLGDGTPPSKMDKEDVSYTDKSTVKGQTCGNCQRAYQHVLSKEYICDWMGGEIVPPGWCSVWRGK